MESSFYLPLGDGRWRATGHTTGPWDADFQHGGPPSALLTRAMETTRPRPDMLTARVSVDILGPIPVGDVAVTAGVLRPGRSVELVEARMRAGDREVAVARSWRVLRNAAQVARGRLPAAPALPKTAEEVARGAWVDGYLSAVEWRFVRGTFTTAGPATVWTRLRVTVVPSESPSPLQRLLAVADSGNGASGELDLQHWHFINPELTVHVHREPAGEWICLDAATTISPGGAGLATSTLSDQEGMVGVGAQSLLVAPR